MVKITVTEHYLEIFDDTYPLNNVVIRNDSMVACKSPDRMTTGLDYGLHTPTSTLYRISVKLPMSAVSPAVRAAMSGELYEKTYESDPSISE